MENSDISYANVKKTAIVVGVILIVVNMWLPLFFDVRSGAGQIPFFIILVALNLTTIFWASYDSLERGERLSANMMPLFIVLGLIALVIYFFKSRGFVSGLAATGILILLILTSGIVGWILFYVVKAFIWFQ